MDAWYEISCADCGTRNLVDNGDITDCTVSDIDGFICYMCDAWNCIDECGEVDLTNEKPWDKGYPIIEPELYHKIISILNKTKELTEELKIK